MERLSFWRVLVAVFLGVGSFLVGSAIPSTADVVGSSTYLIGAPSWNGFFWYCPSTGGQMETLAGNTGVSFSASTLSTGSASSSCTSPSAVNVGLVTINAYARNYVGNGAWSQCGSQIYSYPGSTWYANVNASRACGAGTYQVYVVAGSVYNSGSPYIDMAYYNYITTFYITGS